MRIDRQISLAVSAMRCGPDANRTAVLMYHSISDRAEFRSHPYFNTTTSVARFSQHMQWLADVGAEVVPLETWNAPQGGRGSLRVVVTFDDGFNDFMTNAFPVLQQHGFSATVFLPTAFIDTGRELVAGKQHLSWNDVRQLNASGIGFGSHTAHHFHLEKLSRAEIADELRTSSEAIRTQLGVDVTSFSCPYAFPQAHPAAMSALHESLGQFGYTVAVTTRIGTASASDDPYTLRRLPVNSDDDRALFLAKLSGAYNWLGGMQRVVRSVKKIRTQWLGAAGPSSSPVVGSAVSG